MTLQFATPRAYSPGAALAEGGLPGDRSARLAARQAFVDLKRSFLVALQGQPGGEWLQAQVRAAEEPVDLWLLRGPVFAVLTGTDGDRRQRRQALRRSLDSVFPDLDPPSGFTPL